MKLLVVNGPNLNMLGIREKEIYGSDTYTDLCNMIFDFAKSKNIEIAIKQSNLEGELVTYIQDALFDKVDGIIINPAAYTHTSIAILDALKAVNIPFIEIHISDVEAREEFRKKSYIAPYAKKRIIGHGFKGYIEAIEEFLKDEGKI